MTNTEHNGARIVGTSDDVNACDCCGRSDLKRTVAIMNADGEVNHFGTTCAAYQMFGSRKESAKVNAKLRAIKSEQEASARRIDQIAQLEKSIENYEEWMFAGQVRYMIGGREIGATLESLLRQDKQTLSALQRA